MINRYSFLFLSYWIVSPISHAEITLDGSLGSVTTLTGPNYRIEATHGTQVGANLFHSFGLFNLSNKESATFMGPADITNIIGRVTGGQASSIDGLLKSDIRGANLYLLNPYGIFFGPHASLNINGSLHISTADYLRFADGQQFSAYTATPTLLSVAIPQAFGFLDNLHGEIRVDGSELALPTNKTLSIIGGDIHIKNGGVLAVPQGNIQLASVSAVGEVPLSDITQTLAKQLGEITLEDFAFVDTSGRQAGGSIVIKGGRFFMRGASLQSFASTEKGDIQVNSTGDLEITEGSLIQNSTHDAKAGNISLQGQRVKITNNSQVLSFALGTGQTGDITVNATESVDVEQNGVISTDIGSTGKIAGNIRINTPRLDVIQSGEISSLSNAGTTGNITIQAQQVTVSSNGKIVSASPENTGHLVLTVQGEIHLTENGTIGTITQDGQAGHVTLNTGNLVIMNDGHLSSTALGYGQAGAVNVQAGNNRVSISKGGQVISSSEDGNSYGVTIQAGQLTVGYGGKVVSSARYNSGPVILSITGDLSVDGGVVGTGTLDGQAGAVRLTVGRLVVDAKGNISSVAEGRGQAGEIDVQAGQSVTITGNSSLANSKGTSAPLKIHSPTVNITTGGNIQTADNSIEINAQQLNLSQGEIIITGTQANHLVIQIQGIVNITDNGQIGYKTTSRGGGITLVADTVILDKGGKISSLGSDNQIIITAKQKLQLSNNAEMGSEGGGITLNAPQFTIDNSVISNKSGLNTATNQVVINAERLLLTNGGRIGTETRTAQTGGNVQVQASQSVSLQGQNAQNIPSSIATQTFGTGNAGTLTIISPVVQLATGATISADTQGYGHGGQILIKTAELTLDTGALISSNSLNRGLGGEVSLEASKFVSITSSDQTTGVLANALSSGHGGQIMIVTPSLTLTGNGVITADTADTGHAGNITLTVDQLAVRQGARISTSSHGNGKGGLLTVTANQAVTVSGNGSDGQASRLEADTSSNNEGGHIVVTTPSLLMDAGLIRTIAFKQGNAGNISLEVGQLSLQNGAQINASSQGQGNGGDVTVRATGTIDIVGQTVTTTPTGVISPSSISSGALGEGNGGTIRIFAKSLNLDKRGTIQTLTRGNGNASDIFLEVGDLRITDGADIDASNEGTGQGEGGDITIKVNGTVLITAESVNGKYFGGIYSASENAGRGGNVSLTAGQLTMRDGGVISAESSGTGNAGNLSICLNGALQMHNAAITTQATHAGGGNIDIKTPGRIHLKKSKITARAEGLAVENTGGNVTIFNEDFLILDRSQILASAVAGNGGNISLTSAQFVSSGDSLVDASSQLGVDGGIQINSPDRNISGSLTVLPTVFFDAANLFRNRCVRMSLEKRSKFTVMWAKSSVPAIDDWQPGPP